MEQSRHDATEVFNASASAVSADMSGANAILKEAYNQGYATYVVPPGKAKGLAIVLPGSPNEENLRVLLAAFRE